MNQRKVFSNKDLLNLILKRFGFKFQLEEHNFHLSSGT